MSAPGSETGLEIVQARLEGAPHNVPEAVAEVEGSRPRPAPGDQFPPSAPPHVAAQGPPGEVGDTKGATNEGSIEIDMNEEMCTGHSEEMSQSSDGLPTCLICLEPLRPEDFKSGGAITLKCQCQGNTALRHRSCAQEWARVKGDVNCDICHHPIANLPALPPPPPPPPRPENSTSRPLERLRQTEMKGLWFAVHYPRTTLLLTVFFVLLASTLFWAEMVALNGFFVGLIVLVGSPTMVALLLRVSRWDYASRTGTPPYAQYI